MKINLVDKFKRQKTIETSSNELPMVIGLPIISDIRTNEIIGYAEFICIRKGDELGNYPFYELSFFNIK